MSRMPRIAAGGRWRGIVKVVLLALLQASAAAIAAVATREVFTGLPAAGGAVPVAALWAIALSGIGIALFRWLGGVVAERLGHDYAAALRLRLFRHLARLPASEHARRRPGALSLRFVGDLSAVRLWVSQGLARLLTALIVIPLVVTVLYAIQPVFAALVSAPLIAAMICMALSGSTLLHRHRRLRRQRSSLAADVSERLPVAPQLRLLGRLETESAVIARRSRSLTAAGVARQRYALLLRVLPDVAGGLAAALILFESVTLRLPSADAAAALAALGLLLQPLRDLASCWDRYCAWRTARKRCEALLVQRRLPAQRKTAAREGGAHIKILQRRAGNEQTFSVESGEVVLLRGASGSGKSTLLRRIAGMERSARGRIEIDGNSAVSNAGSGIALIGRDAPMLSGSLRRVLTLGATARPDDAEIVNVARDFGLGDLLSRPGELDQRVSDGGRNLSSGERRRILLARAVLTGPRLLLLDEPEQDLGTEAGDLLGRMLARLAGVTVLMVTEEESLLDRAGRIWEVRRKGRVLETVGSPSVETHAAA